MVGFVCKNAKIRIFRSVYLHAVSGDGFASWYCGEFELESFNTTRPRVQVSQVAWHYELSVTIPI